ncbi:MAG: SIMPL domain-containing protein [Minisyncoccia bacterium]
MEINNQNANSGQGCDCKMCQKCGWCPAGKGHKIMGIILLIVVVIIAGRMICGGHGYNKSNVQKDTITVSGKGEVIVKPDIANISFSVLAEDMDVGKAQTASTEKMTKIINFLKSSGIDEKDIKTTDYSIYPRYDYISTTIYPYNGKQVLSGYDVSQTVSVKIRDISKAGAILSGVGGFGATNMSGLSFTVDNEDAVKLQARDLAVQDARAQAKNLAKSLGVKLVKITAFSESGNYPVYYDSVMYSKSNRAETGASAPAVIPAGQNTVTSNVSVTYEIK